MENIYQNLVVFKIHNGTQRSTVSLCVSCRLAHRYVGSQSGRETVRCNANYQHSIEMREPVGQCSVYQNKNLPTLADMNEIAWTLMTDKGGRKLGFQAPDRRDGQGSPVIGF